MKTALSRDEILAAVRASLADALAVEESEVRAGSRLIDDLGADSLDFLDILFRLEQAFGIQLRNSEVQRLLRAEAPSAPSNGDGALTSEEVARLEGWLPALKGAPDRGRILKRDVFSYITVESLVILVERRLSVAA